VRLRPVSAIASELCRVAQRRGVATVYCGGGGGGVVATQGRNIGDVTPTVAAGAIAKGAALERCYMSDSEWYGKRLPQ
jgi:hypothetical protein